MADLFNYETFYYICVIDNYNKSWKYNCLHHTKYGLKE